VFEHNTVTNFTLPVEIDYPEELHFCFTGNAIFRNNNFYDFNISGGLIYNCKMYSVSTITIYESNIF